MLGFKHTPIQLSETPVELRQVDAVWQAARGDCIAPSRRAVDLMTLPLPLIPFTSITDYDAATDAFTIRFFGTGLVAIDGVDLTGHRLEDTPHPGLRDTLLELFLDIVSTGHPNFAEFTFITLSGVSSMSVSARWPLSEDGANVTGILSVVHPEQHVYDLHKILSRGQGAEGNQNDPMAFSVMRS